MPWKYGVGVAALERLLHEHVDGRAVLGVHHDQPAVAGRGLHRPHDLPVAGQEHARVGHEQLEAGDALADQLVHRLERLVVDLADDLVEGVVDRAVAAGLLVPERDLVLHPLAVGLHDEVDDRGRAAPRRGAGAGLEGVARRRCRRTASPCGCGASMPPGMTYLPVASMTVSALIGPSAFEPGASSAAIVSPSTSTSCRRRAGGRDDRAALDRAWCSRLGDRPGVGLGPAVAVELPVVAHLR